jgi:hypothetical protein
MSKLILLNLRARKRIISTTQRSEQFLFKKNYKNKPKKKRRRENLDPIEKQPKKHRSAPEIIRSTPPRLKNGWQTTS